MSEYKLQREQDARIRIIRYLPKFCGGCLQEGDCHIAGEPSALDRCNYVKKLLEDEINGKRLPHGCEITEELV